MSYMLSFAFIASLFFLISLLVGELLLSKFSNNKISQINDSPHFSAFLGVILIVSAFSIYYTGFKTINLFAVLLIFFYFFYNFKYNKKIKIKLKTTLVTTLTFSVLFLLVSFFHVYATKEELDVLFYGGMLSNGLFENGVENYYGYYHEYLSSSLANTTTPYHYFEMWMTVLFKQYPLSYSFIMVLKYLVYPFLETLIIMSLFYILKSLKLKVNLLVYIAVLFLTIFPLKLILGVFNNSWAAFNFDFWNYPNFILYSFVIVNSLTLFLRNDFKNGLFILLILPIISITTAPAIFTTVFLSAIYLYITKEFTFKNMLLIVISSSILALSIGLFYKITGGPIEPYVSSSDHWAIKYRKAWKAIVYILGTVNITILVFLILLSYYNKKIGLISFNLINKILIICFIAVSSGVFIYQVVFYIDNTYQFVYAGYSLVFNTFILIVLIGLFSLSKIKYLSYVFIGISFIIFIYTLPSIYIKDIRISEFNHFEESELDGSEDKLNLILEKKGKVIVVLNKEILPYVRSFSFRVPLSGLFFLGDYKVITMVDHKVLYSAQEGRVYDANYDKARMFNEKLPQDWYDLTKIDAVAKDENALFIAIPQNDNLIRSKIHLPIVDSMLISKYKILFIKENSQLD